MARLILALLLTAALCSGQKVASVRAGTVYHVERPIAVDGVEVNTRGQTRMPQVEDGQTVATSDGHAELLMGPGAVLWMRAGSRVRFDDTRLTVGHVTLLEGSMLIEIKQRQRDRLITVSTGEQDFGISEEGVFQFDAEPWLARTHDGEMLLAKSAGMIKAGQQASAQGVKGFEREAGGEFFHWAAYRSLVLEKESGELRHWKIKDEDAKHAGFGVRYPTSETGAYIKYLAASEAGMIFSITGEMALGKQEAEVLTRMPLAIGEGNFLKAQGGRVELFLGVGVVARLNQGTIVYMLNASPASPAIRLEEGVAVIEVGDTDDVPVRVEVAGSMTELRKRGVYEFDVARGILSVYDGEGKTTFQKRSLRVKTGERVSLSSTGSVSKFDAELVERPDGRRGEQLMGWSAARSFELLAQNAPFMTNWKVGTKPGEATHKVFGLRRDRRIRPLERAAPTLMLGVYDTEAESRRRQQEERDRQQQQQPQQ